MFGLGGGEIIIVLILAILFIGPKDLPKLGWRIGKLYRQLKFSVEDLKNTIEKEARPPSDE
ncbi:MAG TPA: hypothetical protein DF383_05120 [Deltaproteobacteria bacterium]|nr:hypothetical protein [Deltaproteobacteria bacterium]